MSMSMQTPEDAFSYICPIGEYLASQHHPSTPNHLDPCKIETLLLASRISLARFPLVCRSLGLFSFLFLFSSLPYQLVFPRGILSMSMLGGPTPLVISSEAASTRDASRFYQEQQKYTQQPIFSIQSIFLPSRLSLSLLISFPQSCLIPAFHGPKEKTGAC